MSRTNYMQSNISTTLWKLIQNFAICPSLNWLVQVTKISQILTVYTFRESHGYIVQVFMMSSPFHFQIDLCCRTGWSRICQILLFNYAAAKATNMLVSRAPATKRQTIQAWERLAGVVASASRWGTH